MTLEALSLLEPEVRLLLPEFLRAGRDRLQLLEQRLGERNFQDLRRLGHGLKGSGAMYELAGFEQVGARLEEAATREDPAAVSGLLRELKALLDALAEAIAREPAPARA